MSFKPWFRVRNQGCTFKKMCKRTPPSLATFCISCLCWLQQFRVFLFLFQHLFFVWNVLEHDNFLNWHAELEQTSRCFGKYFSFSLFWVGSVANPQLFQLENKSFTAADRPVTRNMVEPSFATAADRAAQDPFSATDLFDVGDLWNKTSGTGLMIWLNMFWGVMHK